MWWSRLLAAALTGWLCLAGSAAALTEQVVNPVEPPLVETWTLREVWRVGGEDDSPEMPLLGVISRGVADAAGQVYLLDAQLSRVLVFAADGRFLTTLGGPGEGPGEVRRPADIWLYPDGRVGILQSFPAKVVVLAGDGTPFSDSARADPAINLWRARAVAGLTVATGQRNDYEMKTPGQSTTYRFIANLTEGGELDHVYLDKTFVTQWQPPVSDEGKGWFPTYAWDLAADGTLVLAPERERYRLQFVDRSGAVTREMNRACGAYRRTEAEIDAVKDNMMMSSNGRELEVRKIVLETEPMIRAISVLHDGTIWLRTGYSEHDLPDGVYQRYDVLDESGHLLKEVRLVCPARRDEDAFGVMADGRFLWIRNQGSAFRAMYPRPDDEEDDTEDTDDFRLEVIVLERQE